MKQNQLPRQKASNALKSKNLLEVYLLKVNIPYDRNTKQRAKQIRFDVLFRNVSLAEGKLYYIKIVHYNK